MSYLYYTLSFLIIKLSLAIHLICSQHPLPHENHFETTFSSLMINLSSVQQFKVTFRLAFPERPEEKLLLLTEKVANVDKTDGMIRKSDLQTNLTSKD